MSACNKNGAPSLGSPILHWPSSAARHSTIAGAIRVFFFFLHQPCSSAQRRRRRCFLFLCTDTWPSGAASFLSILATLAPSLFTLASLCLSRTTGCPGSVFALSRLSDAQIPHHRPPGDSASPLLSSAVSFFLLSSTDYPAWLKTKGCPVVTLTRSLQFGF